jgi:5-methyltetrahydrofolate--homocysteine methyltransferase
MNFRNILGNKILYLDGAMGTQIQKRIDNVGTIPEELNITHADVITAIHKDYVNSGSNIALTNTFGANAYKLKNSKYTVDEIISSAVENAKKASPDFVGLDIGPIGALIGNLGEISFDEAYYYFTEQIVSGVNAGADLIVLETMTDIYEMKAAILAAKDNCSLPILASMTYEENERTLTGSDPLTVVTILESLGVDIIGINCSVGPVQMKKIVKELVKYSSIPLMVQPNAGLPKEIDGKTVYDIGINEFCDNMKDIVELGAWLIGGCCGTTPQYIESMVNLTSQLYPKPINKKNNTVIASGTKTVCIGNEIKIIGERINPTGKKKLKTALKNKDISYIQQLASQQKMQGAHILDVNVGLPEINELTMMVDAIEAVQKVVDLPVQIDSSDPKVIGKALRYYNGKAIINSVNGENDTMDAIFPLAKKYGGCVLGLTMDSNGIPEKAVQRLKIAEKIVARAEEYGIARKDILIDSLVLTASAQQDAVFETVKAVSLIKRKLGVKTVLGVSNVSFGFPNRPLLNRTYLTMTLSAGLDAPIMNSADEMMMDAIKAFEVLKGIDKEGLHFISSFGNQSKIIQGKENNDKSLSEIVIGGFKEEAGQKTLELLKTSTCLEIINEILIPALDIVGDKFETGEFFLPQLIFASETAQESFKIIRNHLINIGEEPIKKGKIILATVKGDVHDIGKDIVKVILENYGYEILDLGKDVDPEIILQTVLREDVSLVGLSALMTTTVKNMETTINLLKENVENINIMVGGAVLNQEYADMIGADFYAKNAKDGIEISKKVIM